MIEMWNFIIQNWTISILASVVLWCIYMIGVHACIGIIRWINTHILKPRKYNDPGLEWGLSHLSWIFVIVILIIGFLRYILYPIFKLICITPVQKEITIAERKRILNLPDEPPK